MFFKCIIFFPILLTIALRVDKIQGLNFKLYSNHYSGFLNVSKTNRFFYWFIESENTPSADPLIFWFNGGPGCSSLTGLLREHGPILLNSDGETFRENKYSWSRIASVVYIESPVGVGYSYSTSNSNTSNSDDETAIENYEAIKQFFKDYPQFRHHDVFLTGESYGGIYVPMLVEKIIDGQNEYQINLEGIAIGNGFINEKLHNQSQILTSYSKGLVKVNKLQSHLKSYCNGSIRNCIYSEKSPTSWEIGFVDGIDYYNTRKNCPTLQFCVPYMRKNLEHFFNDQNVRKNLNIPHAEEWKDCKTSIISNYQRTTNDVKHHIRKAVENNVRTLLYYGDADLICSFQIGQTFAATLGIKKIADKSHWFFNSTLGGYKTLYDGLTFLTVRGGGHSVPETHPAQMFYIIQQFINDENI